MSTARAALFVLLVGCSSKKADPPPPAAPCVPADPAAHGAGFAVVDGVEATVCFASSCVRIDRDGKVIAAIATAPTPPIPQVQQDRQVGTARVVARDPAGQWTLKHAETGASLPVGAPGDRLDVVDPASVVAYQGTKLQVADPADMKIVGTYTMPGTVAAVLPWFDRVFVVLEKPAGTMQIDPATATVYTGPALPICR
jgi:hypothetical protein